jgi:hypothetical protein
MTATESKWAERVREWKAGKRTAQEFAEGQGFKASTLTYWASRLRQSTVPSAAPAKRPRRVRMVQVTRAPRGDDTVVVVVGAARVVVRPGFDGALLREVVRALGGAA